MSLTSIISSRKDIRDGLRTRTAHPPVRLGLIRAMPQTTHYGLVGTAFDYLLRFVLQRLNPAAEAGRWTAELGAEKIGASEYVYQMDKRELTQKDRRRLEADKRIAEAKAEHRRYLKSGAVTDELLEAVLRLATLDVVHRAGPDVVDWTVFTAPDPRDLADLRALLALVDHRVFKAEQVCVLNPEFGLASELVGGADSDLLVDDALIDIKVTQNPRLDARDFCQLVGYYLLYGLDGIHGAGGKASVHQVNCLGLYFARFGYLWKFPVTDLFAQNSAGEAAKWFFEAICVPASRRAKYAKRFRGPLAAFVRESVSAMRQLRTPKGPARARATRRSHKGRPRR